MKEYGVYAELGELVLVAVVDAESYEEAKAKARKEGYGKEYRIEAMED